MAWGSGNVGGGGSGGTSPDKAVIIITAPTGSKVSAAYNGKIKNARENAGTWTFSNLEVGKNVVWVITASKGSDKKVINIPTPQPDFYREKIEYYFYLYEPGNQYPSLTGGWKGTHVVETTTPSGGGNVKFEPEGMRLNASFVLGSHYAAYGVVTNKIVNTNGFKTIAIEYDYTSKGGLTASLFIGQSERMDRASAKVSLTVGTDRITRLSIPKISGGIIGVGTPKGGGDSSVNVLIKGVYLE